MKKILTLSALGCLATVGAVFAAFTLDPTTESTDIENSNIDVDFSSDVFSTFELLEPETGKTYPTFDYKPDSDDPTMDVKNIPVVPSRYTFRANSVGDYGSLELDCDDRFIYKDETKSGVPTWDEYILWRHEHQDPDPIEDAKRAPHGHAFRYEYDPEFIAKVDAKTGKEGMPDYAWHIYNTLFSTGLTKSDFKSEELSAYHITYTNPSETSPDYKEFTWDKTNKANLDSWVHGSEGFLIIPDVEENSQTGLDEPTDHGIMIFTGQEMTDDIFGGAFESDDDRTNCETYLNSVEEGKYTKRNFSTRIKAEEYTASEEHTLTNEPPIFYEVNRNNGALIRDARYKFSVDLASEAMTYIGSSYNLGRFYILNKDRSAVIPLLAEGGDVSELKLKVTVKGQDGTVQDITSQFAYGNVSTDAKKYGTIYYNKPSTGAYSPKEGDKVSIEFTLKCSGEKIGEWSRAEFELTNTAPDGTYSLTDSPLQGHYRYDFDTVTPVQEHETHRFVTPVDPSQYLSTFSIVDDTSKPQEINVTNAKIYLLDARTERMTLLHNDNAEGGQPTATYDSMTHAIVINGELLLSRYGITSAGTHSIVVDITNLKGSDDLKMQSAQLRYTDAPTIYNFGKFTQEGTEEISSGSFVTDTTLPEEKRTLTLGDEINFDVDLTDEKFYKLLQGIATEDPVKHLATFKFVLTDADGNEVTLATGDLSFAVLRLDPTGGQEEIKEKNFKWVATNPGTISQDTSETTETMYVKALISGIEKGYTKMRIQLTYAGTDGKVFDKATLSFTVTNA